MCNDEVVGAVGDCHVFYVGVYGVELDAVDAGFFVMSYVLKVGEREVMETETAYNPCVCKTAPYDEDAAVRIDVRCGDAILEYAAEAGAVFGQAT